MIKTTRIAYKIGFSSALNPNAISAYQEAARWIFDSNRPKRLLIAFCKGFLDAEKIRREVNIENRLSKQVAAM